MVQPSKIQAAILASSLLHVIAFSLLVRSDIPGSRFRVSAQPEQSTLRVGLVQSMPAPLSKIGKAATVSTPSSEELPGAGVLAPAVPAARLNQEKRDVQDELPSPFVPSAQLDRKPVPVSAPDVSLIQDMTGTSVPIRIRLFISETGKVLEIHVLQVDPADAEVAAQVQKMFYATAFLPGRQKMKDVPSFIDIELQISDFAGVPRDPVR